MAAGLENPEVVDLVTHNPATNEYALIMVQDRVWARTMREHAQLLEKTRNYLAFVASGQFAKNYPEASGAALRIQLDCVDEPGFALAATLDEAQALVVAAGLRFVVEVLPA